MVLIMQNRNGNLTMWAVLGILVLAVLAIWWFQPPAPPTPSEQPGRSKQTPAETVKQGETRELASPKDRPKKIPQDAITKFYKEGKTVNSLALLNMTGQGTNRDWGIKGNAHFAYQYRIAVQTKVKQNRGTAVVFEQFFGEVVQIRAESNSTIQLSMPDSPIVQIVWEKLDRYGLEKIPGYTELKDLIKVLDPDLKQTLTFIRDQLKKHGMPVPDPEVPPIAARMDDLRGLKVEIEYISGLGVVYVKPLNKDFDAHKLDQLAYHSSLMMDYIMGEEVKKPVGLPFDVAVKDVRAACGLMMDVEADGTLKLSKKEEADRHGEKVSVLDVLGGNVTLAGTVDGLKRTGNITPQPGGYVHYSADKLLVRLAKLSWTANANWVSKDHLLFGTEKVVNLKMETYYEADLAKEDPVTQGTSDK